MTHVELVMNCSVPVCHCHTQNVNKSFYFYFFIHRKTLKFNNFSIIGPNATKQSPCTPPCRGLSDSTKHVTVGHKVREISPWQTKQTNKTKQTTLLNGRIFTTRIDFFDKFFNTIHPNMMKVIVVHYSTMWLAQSLGALWLLYNEFIPKWEEEKTLQFNSNDSFHAIFIN